MATSFNLRASAKSVIAVKLLSVKGLVSKVRVVEHSFNTIWICAASNYTDAICCTLWFLWNGFQISGMVSNKFFVCISKEEQDVTPPHNLLVWDLARRSGPVHVPKLNIQTFSSFFCSSICRPPGQETLLQWPVLLCWVLIEFLRCKQLSLIQNGVFRSSYYSFTFLEFWTDYHESGNLYL